MEPPCGSPHPNRIAVVTGTRAEFGLLEPVMRAIEEHAALELLVVVAGAHLLPPSRTRDEVAERFPIAAEVEMQLPGEVGRVADAHAVARGIAGLTDAFTRIEPDWVVVLGDRIEAFAAASAAAVAGIPFAHIHGGDRAEGVADESMRHAITKLAHTHFPATEQSADRIARMGEDEWRIHTVGSPAIDTLAMIEPIDERAFAEFGSPPLPRAVFLMHPIGRADEEERAEAHDVLSALHAEFGQAVLCLHPNFDPGRAGILAAISSAEREFGFTVCDHLPRRAFVALLKAIAARDGIIAGNSSAALIEAAALRLPAVDLGPRQGGRERPNNVAHGEARSAREAITKALSIDRDSITHPYGRGRAGEQIAHCLAQSTTKPALLRKRNTY